MFQAKRKAQKVCRRGWGGWKACAASCVHFGQNELPKQTCWQKSLRSVVAGLEHSAPELFLLNRPIRSECCLRTSAVREGNMDIWWFLRASSESLRGDQFFYLLMAPCYQPTPAVKDSLWTSVLLYHNSRLTLNKFLSLCFCFNGGSQGLIQEACYTPA